MPRKPARIRCLPPRVPAADLRRAPPPPQTADSHYRTPEHVAWAAAVIARAAGRCQGTYQGRPCARRNVRLFADHIRELRDGGAPLDLANGQALCGSCHTAKTNRARAARMSAGP